MLKIVILGTAASIATKQRDNTSLVLYRNKGDPILIDCPGSIVQKLKRAGLDYTKLKKIIITHHHPDHIYGIISLLHCQFKTTKKVTIFSSKTSITVIKELIKLFGLTTKDYPRVRFVDILNKRSLTLSKGIRLLGFKNRHCRDSFGINITYNKYKNMVYSSDTAVTRKILSYVNKNTCLIHDCTASKAFFKKNPGLYKMHTESSQLSKLATLLKPGLLIPIHFLLLEKGEFSKIKRELKGVKNLLLPYDYCSLALR